MRKAKRPIIRAFARVNSDHMLYDRRMGYGRVIFGTVSDVAKQYRIKINETYEGLEFEGEQDKMQIFVQRLHFAGIPYKEIP